MNDARNERRDFRSSILNRLLGLYLLLGLWVLALVVRLAYLQVFNSAEYRLESEQQQIGFVELSPRRGDILDRHLDALAVSVRIDSVFAHPRKITHPRAAAKALAPILGEHEQAIYKKLISERPFVYLGRKIPPRQAEQIRALGLEGIHFQEESKRVYPGRRLAAHVLGYVGLDNEGLSGLEYRYNDLIKGEKATVHLRFDAKRQSYESQSPPEQSAGNVMVLSIDRAIQYAVEQVLEQTMASTRAVSGSAVVMDPHTGEVLAMASWPAFNPNRFADFQVEQRRNRAILDIYEPGSAFKIVTFSAVLNEGLAHPGEVIDCRVGTVRLANKVYREAKESFGLLGFNEILAKSSNVGTIKLALRLREENLYEYIKRFGIGEQSGIDLPGEQAGLLRPPGQWSRISIGALSIGQEVGVTPLQMLRSACAVANGGFLVKPRVVNRILSPEGDVLYEAETESRQVLHSGTAAKMKQALELVVKDGTGKSAALTGYSSGGKTGTSQKFVDGSYSRSRYVASYVGFAPVDDPALAAIVVINEPRGEYYASQVAAPAFKQIMERALIHLDVTRDLPVEPEGPPRMELTSGRGISIDEEQLPRERLEETVLSLIEEDSPGQASRHQFVISTNTFSLPDFSGMSLREVGRQCAALGLRLKVSGSGLAVGQRPDAGAEISSGAVCEVFFSKQDTDASSRIIRGSEGQMAGRSR